MSVVLSQSSDASFPDRPVADGVGLSVVFTTGADGQYLEVDLGAPRAVLHTRIMINPNTVAGGQAVILRGLDDSTSEVFRVSYHGGTRALDVSLASGHELSTTLPTGLPWHCVEIAIDTQGGQAELWLNGLSVANEVDDFSSLQTRSVWVGGVYKDLAATGVLYLDEWVLADGYIGPVTVAPSSEFGNDPARWLVVYNAADSDSIDWVDHYRRERGVPYANLCGLQLSGDETIDAAGFASLNNAIGQFLVNHGLDDQVLGVLLGYGVPGYTSIGGEEHATSSLLHTAAEGAGTLVNELAADGVPTRPTQVNLSGRRLTARIDAPDLDGAKALVDQATSLMKEGLGDGSSCTIWLDPYTSPGPVNDSVIQSMVDWSSSLDRMRTRLPIQLSADNDPQQEVSFTSVQADGFVWGWQQATPPAGFFAEPAGDRVFCLQVDLASATAPTLRGAQPTDWAETAIAHGYAAAAGSSGAVLASSMPLVRPFFEALRSGWTLAEAWFVALPVLRDHLFLVGDPLLTVALPKAGWDVFGPVDQLEHLDAAAATLALPEYQAEATLAAQSQPALDEHGYFLVRHVDGVGRSESNARPVRVTRVASGAAKPPLPPLWPGWPDWPVLVDDNAIELTLVLDQSADSARVQTVELLAQIDGGSEQVIETVTPAPAARIVRLLQGLPQQSARYRWRLRSAEGSQITTDWSLIVTPKDSPSLSLQPVETYP